MKFLKISVVICLISSVWACKNDAPATPASNSAQPAAAPATKAEVLLYRVDVDNLLIRDQPTQKGAVLTKLPEGDFVIGNGEVSANKEEVTLREITYNEPFFKVQTNAATPVSGWAYSAALKIVYAGSKAQSPDLGQLTQFSTFLKTLKINDINSGKKAWDYVNTNFSGASGAMADAVYSMLNDFLNRMIFNGELYGPLDKISWSDDDYTQIMNNTFSMSKYPATKALADNGFTVDEGEGQVFPIPDWQKLNAFFMPRTTPSMQSYLKLESVESKDPSSDDGGLVITMEQLIDRAAGYEQFVEANPVFFLNEQVKSTRDYYLVSIINGMDNTPVAEWESKEITPEAKKAWAYAVQKYPNTVVGKCCKEISSLAAAAGWKRDEKVETYQTELAKQVFQN